jgi:hypothetical protein
MKQKMKSKHVGTLNTLNSLLLIFFITIVCSCNSTSSGPGTEDSNIQKGKELASVYCKSCHTFPDPSLLGKRIWVDDVLPGMAPRLGIFDESARSTFDRYNEMLGEKYYPSSPVLQSYQWQQIIDYYHATAPDSLVRPKRNEEIKSSLPLFTVQMPAIKLVPPSSCMVRIDTLGGKHELLVADTKSSTVFRFDNKLRLIDSVFSKGPIVDMNIEKDKILACNIGYFNPTDLKKGSAEFFELNSHEKMHLNSVPLFDTLKRPVQVTPVDLNQDKRTDYLVCEFGNLTGTLSWMENTGQGNFVKHILRSMPGAIKAYVRDFNNDGLPDICALFAQGDEGIFLFMNKGNGQFEEKRLLSFPPVYGSSYFELDDFNGDGFPDILYTCGDNADYSKVLKPYHGIYIFLNDGKNDFTQKYFFPMDGCFKAMARDFDGDGDLDIAAISFFADYEHHPEEGFMYLENKGNFKFQPYVLPELKSGRWITMDAGDIYGNGKQDIIIGNFDFSSMQLGAATLPVKSQPFVVLKNMSK